MNSVYHIQDRNCPICSSLKKSVLFRQQFSSISDSNLLTGYDVVSCDECNFCFADKLPEQSRFDQYYKELSKYENEGDELRSSSYDLKRFGILVAAIKEFLNKPDMHIVEVGCATGLLLSLIKNAGFTNITAIDPSPACTAVAKKHFGLNVMTTTLSGLDLEPGSVDLLILVGVLEHVKDLDSSLRKIRTILSDDGKFYIAVPDASEYYSGEDAPFQEFSVEHINFFGPTSLSNLLKKYGFSTLKVFQDLIEVNHRTFTPVLHAFFSKTSYNTLTQEFVADKHTKDNLVKYIEVSSEKENNLNATIEKLIEKDDPIIVWGTGAQTLRLLATTQLNRADIKAFVDSNPKYQGKNLNGRPIVSPAMLKERKEAILISTRAYQNEIEKQIREELKIGNDVIKLY